MVTADDKMADDEVNAAAYPIAANVLRAAIGAAIRTVLEEMQDGALRTLVVQELMAAERRVMRELN